MITIVVLRIMLKSNTINQFVVFTLKKYIFVYCKQDLVLGSRIFQSTVFAAK